MLLNNFSKNARKQANFSYILKEMISKFLEQEKLKKM